MVLFVCCTSLTIPQSAVAADSSLYTREPEGVSSKEAILQNLEAGRKSSKCNTIGAKNFGRRSPSKTFPRAVVDEQNSSIHMLLGDGAKVKPLWEEETQDPIHVFICATLPRLVGLGKINGRPQLSFQCPKFRKLGAIIQTDAPDRKIVEQL